MPRAWKDARVLLPVVVSLAVAVGIATRGRGRTVDAPTALPAGSNVTGGRVVYGLPLEMELRDKSVFWVGGDVAAFWLEVPEPAAPTVVALRAGGQICRAGDDGLPRIDVHVDSVLAHTFAVDAPITDLRVYQSPPLAIAPGVHRVVLTFSNDYYGGADCDRNVSVTQLLVTRLQPR